MLLSDASLIFLDEPVSSLDPVLGTAALQTVQEEASSRHATLVVSLHDVNLARNRFSRLIGIRDGRIQFDLSPTTLREDALAALYGAELSLAASSLVLPDQADVTPPMTRCF